MTRLQDMAPVETLTATTAAAGLLAGLTVAGLLLVIWRGERR